MLGRLVARLRKRIGRDDEQFAGSRLDASVNYSHGGNDAEAARALRQTSDEAERLRDADDRR